MSWFWPVLAVAVTLGLSALLASYFYEIACEKGFSEKRFFWIAFLFGIVGYLLVIALPDRKKDHYVPQKPVAPLFKPQEAQSNIGKWACPDCGNVLPGDVVQCKCGYRRS